MAYGAPDLTISQVVGGGLPAAAYGGSRALLEQIARPVPCTRRGAVGQSARMAAGWPRRGPARPGTWERAERWGRGRHPPSSRGGGGGGPLTVQRVGTMFTPFFTGEPVRDFAGAKRTDKAAYSAFFHAMLQGGVYLPPSAFEASFTSAVHGDVELAALETALGSAWAR